MTEKELETAIVRLEARRHWRKAHRSRQLAVWSSGLAAGLILFIAVVAIAT